MASTLQALTFIDVLSDVALSDGLSGPPVSVLGSNSPPEGSAQGSLLSLPTLSLALSQQPVCCCISPSLTLVILCLNNLRDFPCKLVLHESPCKACTPSPWIFCSCTHHNTLLSPLLVSFPFVCLPLPLPSFLSSQDLLGHLPSVTHTFPQHPSSRSIFTGLSRPQLPLSFPR